MEGIYWRVQLKNKTQLTYGTPPMRSNNDAEFKLVGVLYEKLLLS